MANNMDELCSLMLPVMFHIRNYMWLIFYFLNVFNFSVVFSVSPPTNKQ